MIYELCNWAIDSLTSWSGDEWIVFKKFNIPDLVEEITLCLSIILKWNIIYNSSNTTILCFINLNNGDQFRAMQTIQLPQALIIENYTIVNEITWQWRIIHCIHRHSSFYKYFGLMMACIGRNYLSLFKLVKHKIVVFDEVYTLFHFNNIPDVYQWRIFMYLERNIFSEI